MVSDVSFDPMALYDFGKENLDPNITYCIEAQEIFEIGTHKGQPYTGGKLETIVENFKRFFYAKPIPLLIPPAVIGHEEDQDILKRSDLPAAGWVKALFIIKGTKLAANIGEIPALVMYWIKTGRIRTVSAEIYDDSGDAGLPPGYGPTFRRLAFLGGDVPQVKTLDRIKQPVPESRKARMFSERLHTFMMPVSRNLRYFAEGKTMKHPKLFDDMKKEGIDEELASKMSDMEPDMLRKMSACMKKYGDNLAPPAADPANPTPPAFDRAAAIEMIASKNGIDRAMLEGKTDDELKALMGPATMSDDDPTPTKVGDSQDPDDRIEDTTGGGTTQPSAIAQKHSEKSKVRKHSEGSDPMIDDLRSRLARMEEQNAAQKRRERLGALKAKQVKVNKFCEDAIKEGKITPAELSAGKKDLLMALDDDVVRKFSDGTSATALQKEMDVIMKRPKIHVFSEKMPTSPEGEVIEKAERRKLLSATERGRKILAREDAAAAKA